MTEPTLTERLRDTALCETDHLATAATALITAAALILEVDEANALMRRMGLRQRYRPDGSGYELAPGDPDPCPAPNSHEDGDGNAA